MTKRTPRPKPPTEPQQPKVCRYCNCLANTCYCEYQARLDWFWELMFRRSLVGAAIGLNVLAWMPLAAYVLLIYIAGWSDACWTYIGYCIIPIPIAVIVYLVTKAWTRV